MFFDPIAGSGVVSMYAFIRVTVAGVVTGLVISMSF
jgi:hypothetical protein